MIEGVKRIAPLMWLPRLSPPNVKKGMACDGDNKEVWEWRTKEWRTKKWKIKQQKIIDLEACDKKEH
jgi:hypothetical protein